MDAITLKNLTVILTEYFALWTALSFMNETKAGRWPHWLKILLTAAAQTVPTLIVYQLFAESSSAISNFINIPLLLYSFLIGRLLFTSEPIKIFLSLMIANVFGGIVEILSTLIYAALRGYDLRRVYSYTYDDHLLEQWFVLAGTFALFLWLLYPLFRRFRRLRISPNRYWYILVVLFFTLPPLLNAKPVGMFKNHGWYIGTVTSLTTFAVILVLFFGYLRKQLLQSELQKLYLEQKMQMEYQQVFDDMDNNIRCFRHDVSKHIDALDFLTNTQELRIPADQLLRYRQSLRQIYEELTRGSYCGKPDLNAVLMRTDRACRDRNIRFHVSLKDLDADSLPVYLRMQLAETMSEWAVAELDKAPEGQSFAALTVSGTSAASFHMLSFSLEREKQRPASPPPAAGRSQAPHIKRTLKKLLLDYHPSVKIENSPEGKTLIMTWHSLKKT